MEFRILKYALVATLLLSCEKEIFVDLPPDPTKIVVEGQIEDGGLPILLLSESQAFFQPVDVESVSKTIINDAKVRMVINEGDTIPLRSFCSGDLPDTLRIILARQSGLEFLANPESDICIYTSLDQRARGKINSRYELLINARGQFIKSKTQIPPPVALDSLWYKKDGARDSLGFIWATLSDPANKYNAYRWFAQRINQYTYGPNKGETKDPFPIAPFGSAFEDEFFDGLSFDFVYNRGTYPGSTKNDDQDIEAGYFKEGDTILVKFTTIDESAFQYFRSYYTAIGNTGSPFATPTNIKTNVDGGLGVWVGYGVATDTLVAVDLE
ncbi:DUF4249 domain-containing protein [Luteibaculum oceani]|uniref:DUF4249 domain-containing protein n=1 Tax=Luteibaculum oceani TaxID=1294296 RepID=A0A5C6VCS0_9FLAO|nr:DUF4249 domain-containing protein [Luteibaculum oceani]TXC81345.1 DUF4249 domain-containing protein [Luteibaculum oceani]